MTKQNNLSVFHIFFKGVDGVYGIHTCHSATPAHSLFCLYMSSIILSNDCLQFNNTWQRESRITIGLSSCPAENVW
jgi:hypothetical protein